MGHASGPLKLSNNTWSRHRAPLAVILFGLLACSSWQGCLDLWNDADTDSGFSIRTYVDANGNPHRYVLFLPPAPVRTDPAPVILVLNGKGENGDNGIAQVYFTFGPQVWRMRDFFPFIVVAPQCRKEGDWSADSLDTRWAFDILDSVIEEQRGDQDRVYLTGVSAGGAGVWRLASAFPERFAAIAPVCGSCTVEAEPLIASRLPVCNFMNDGDESGLVTSSRRMRQQLLRGGMSPLFVEYRMNGHLCWPHAYNSSFLYEWLLEQRKSSHGEEVPFRYDSPPEILKEWLRVSNGLWTVKDREELIGTASDGDSEAYLATPLASSALELHADVWVPARGDVQLALLDDDHSGVPRALISLCAINDGTGGISLPRENLWVAPLRPQAQNSVKPDLWNDVRVRWERGTLELRLNGWPAAKIILSEEVGDNANACRLALVAGRVDGSGSRWRHVRFRELPVSEGTPKEIAGR